MQIDQIKEKVIQNKKALAVTLLVAAISGLLIGLVTPDEYYSKTRFTTILSVASGDFVKKGLEKIKKLAGLSLPNQDQNFDPALIPEIVYNRGFFEHISKQKVPINFEGDSAIFIEYFLFEGAPQDADDEEMLSHFRLDTPRIISKFHAKKQKQFFKSITFDLDFDTDVFSVGAKADNPVLAYYLSQLTLKYIEIYVTKYQLEKKEQEIQYLLQRREKSLQNYENSGFKIADFLNRYQDLFDEKVKFEYEKLRNDHDINYGVLSEVSAQLEIQKFALEEKKPIVYIIEESVINIEPISLSTGLYVVIFTFLSGIFFVLILFRKELIKALVNI